MLSLYEFLTKTQMKNLSKTQIATAAGSALVLVLVIAAVSSRGGGLLQGSLTGSDNSSSQVHSSAFVMPVATLLTPSNQLRPGLNSVLKAKITSLSATQLSKLKVRFDFTDLAFSNISVIVNGNDLTNSLTADNQVQVHASVDDTQGKNKTFVFEFAKPVALEAGQNTVEVVLNADALTVNSVLASSLIDMVVTDNGQSYVVEGPAEKAVLKVNYTTAQAN